MAPVFAEVDPPEEDLRLPMLLADLGDRVVVGSDLPSIPHTYARAVRSIIDLGMSGDWLRAVLHDNGAQLLEEGVAR